jgi:Mg2+/Co2+ transporter CorB
LVVRVTFKIFGATYATEDGVRDAMTELRGAIEVHTNEEVAEERRMLRSILDLADVGVAEVMTHRRTVATIDAGQAPSAIVDQVLSSPYTRIPLWKDQPDNIVGVIHAKDLLRAVRELDGELDQRLDPVALSTKPWFVPDTTTLLEQLEAFRKRREHFALVVDEYGSLLGVVTLEDILEEIVGDIADEHDVTVAGVKAQPDGSFVVDGAVTLRDLNREFEWRLPDEQAATIAGLVLHESRQIPDIGQVFLFYGFRFEVLRRQRNQITSLRITPPQAPSDEVQ